MRTQVCIIGGGPSGLLLSELLYRHGIDSVVLERQSRTHVLGRIRAGVLEFGTVELLRRAGVGARMDRQGIIHDGIVVAAEGRAFRVDFRQHVGKQVMVYGQTEITQDLYDAADARDGRIIHGVDAVTLNDLETDAPWVSYGLDGTTERIDCDFVAGCDGFHGVSRRSIPARVLREYEKVYPFGWLGVLSETPPASDEVLYANHPDGFALCSMRNTALSRYYIQTSLDDHVDNWSDQAFWDTLRRRLPAHIADTMITGPSIEKSIAPLRSYVAEPMRWGRLFLAGDAAHIVPPTGAKGLNLAASDIHYLFSAISAYYDGDPDLLDTYSDRALARVWNAIRFSWWFTERMHRFPGQTGIEQRLQEAEIAYLEQSEFAQKSLAENYVGMPY